jgi:predicted short-subunit dehydrogenase-like oxidoreductase (DUF2520 family)
LLHAGYRLLSISSREIASAEALAAALPADVAVASIPEAVSGADTVFLTVSDGAIGSLARSLPWREGQAVIHCSGAHGLDVLAPITEVEGMAGCFHPLQSFPSREPEAGRFRGISIGIEAPAPLAAFLESLATAFEASSFRLEGVKRALYHAAAVFASNHVVALMAAATRTWQLAGLDPATARAALSPLLLGAANNIATHDLAAALTGPIARGDIATVEHHLAALAASPDLRGLYTALARELIGLPLGHSPETSRHLFELLNK